MSLTSIVLWELHSERDPPARCQYRHTHLTPHLVTVTVAGTERISEQVQSEAEALDEASYLLDDFALRGWVTVVYRDSRLKTRP